MRCKGVLICIPAMGQMMCAKTAETLYCIGQMLTKRGIPNQLSWFSAADIEDIRNLFTTVWYDHRQQFSHLLFLDADMGFDARLIEDMIHFDKPLTGVIYARRSQEVSIVGTLPENHGTKDVVKGFMKSPGGLGTGVMLISREVIDTILENNPDLIDNTPGMFETTTDFRLTSTLHDANFRISSRKWWPMDLKVL